MAKSIECRCTDSFTCGYCCRNAKPYLFTPSAPESFADYCKRKNMEAERQAKEKA